MTVANNTPDLPEHWTWAIDKAATLGWEIFPCNDRVTPDPRFTKDDWSKRPQARCNACRRSGYNGKNCYDRCGHRLCHGLLGATNDVALLTEWAARFPSANLALRTGPVSGVFVLDVDGDAGVERLAELVAEHGPLPTTRKHLTGGGTPHHLFRYPATRRNANQVNGEWRNNAATLLGSGLDTRGAGGYVILPGSSSRKGHYTEALDADMVEPPEWLLKLLETPQGGKPKATDPNRPKATILASGSPGEYTAGMGLHPWIAAGVDAMLSDLAARRTPGSNRTNLLAGRAKRMSEMAGVSGGKLTESWISDRLMHVSEINGYISEHGYEAAKYQVDRNIADGRGGTPQGWPPPPTTYGLIHNALVADDRDVLDALREALGEADYEDICARVRRAASEGTL